MAGVLGVQQSRLAEAHPENPKKDNPPLALTHGPVPSSASILQRVCLAPVRFASGEKDTRKTTTPPVN